MVKDYLAPWQKVIFRNYGKVENSAIGRVLGLNADEVVSYAEKMGLSDIVFSPLWKEKGFVTVIRDNWDILPDKEIAALLDITEQKLYKLLAEYDFLDVKLGKKPIIKEYSFRPLSKEEEKNTQKIRELVSINKKKKQAEPFDFFNEYFKPFYYAENNTCIKDRFVSSYSAKYSGSLLDENLSDYSEEYIKRLAETGTNGIWLSDTLRNLAAFPFDVSLSSDYNVRIKNLKKLTERCKKYGVNVYLYLNEPRSLPESFFDKYPDLKGQRADDGTFCLCTSKKEVREYLYNAIKFIAESVPDLYAVMTITMSENPTHCYSRLWNGNSQIETDCPACKKRKPCEVVAEVNNLMSRALKDGNGRTKLIANVWGWANYAGNDKKELFDTIDLLDKDVEIMCVSEYKKEFVRGGVKCMVDDYSISVGGPSELAESIFSYAKRMGHKTWAKIQVNNSWECSAVPYIPVFDLMTSHIRRLYRFGVSGLMLGWSLGGYLGGALPLVNSVCESPKFDQKKWYKATFGESAEEINNATKIFCKAFTNFPFSVESIYFGAHNMGCGNLWSLYKENRESTMVCFTFDDVEKWTKPYGAETYISLMSALCSEWEEGLSLIKGLNGNCAVKQFVRCAKATYIHFKSALNLARFAVLKPDLIKNKNEIKKCLNNEIEITKELYALIQQDALIGFEMTNHYYYSENLLLEKIVSCYNALETIQ